MDNTAMDNTAMDNTDSNGHDRCGPRSHRDRDERGEGVISTAIAVLIVALLGVVLWTGFSTMMTDATDKTRQQVEQIGQ